MTLAYLGNLSSDLTTPTLQSILSLCGSLKSLKRPADSFALIEFEQPQCLLMAKQLFSGLSIAGKLVSVKVQEESASESAIEEGELTSDGLGSNEAFELKRREMDRILHQKRIPFQREQQRERDKDRSDNQLLSELRGMEADFAALIRRQQERNDRHAREIASLQQEMREYEQKEDKVPSSFRASRPGALRKEEEIFCRVIEEQERRLQCLPCTYSDLKDQSSSSAGVMADELEFCKLVTAKLGLPEKIARIAIDSLGCGDPLSELCSDPLFLLHSRGPVEAEILLSCILRRRLFHQ